MIESSRIEAEQQAQASVAHLTSQVGELTAARESSRTSLAELRAKIDKALSIAEG
jgi:chaperonin cofactor prefoldin